MADQPGKFGPKNSTKYSEQGDAQRCTYNRLSFEMASSINHSCSRSGGAWCGRCWGPETSLAVAEVVVGEDDRGS